MKLRAFLLVSIALSSPFCFADTHASPPIPSCDELTQEVPLPETVLRKSSTATAVRALGNKSAALSYKGNFYPTQAPAKKQSSRFEGNITDGRGAQILCTFEIQSKNMRHNGQRAAIWKETGEASLYTRPFNGIVAQEIDLRFEDARYRTPSAATSRVAIYVGVIVDGNGDRKQISVEVDQRNLQPNGSLEPIWENSGEATVSLQAI